MSTVNFSDLSLSQEMLHNLNKIGYKQTTPVQAATLPHILKGRDVIAQAKTGSGKTAAFGIGLLTKLQVKKYCVQTLVLCPTRELADQVAKELRVLARFADNIKILTLCGGTAFRPQEDSLRHEAHIIVGTPGRVLKHLDKNTLNLKDVDTLIFDEADRMLDMGFIDDIEKVLAYTPKNRQTLLFSATYTDEIRAISDKFQSNAMSIKTTDTEVANKITEVFYEVKEASKFNALVNVLSTYQPENVIIFTNTKAEANELAQSLKNHNIDALATHGDLEQYERNDVLVQFANKSCRILIATDVAARGLDIKELAMVINYDIPHNEETYTHRIGRTARAGQKGIAITLYNSNRSFKALNYQTKTTLYEDSNTLKTVQDFEMKPLYKTLVIEAGKKDKLRPGDLLGALTGDVGVAGNTIGKIDIYDRQSYVAIDGTLINSVHKKLSNGKIKGKKFPVWLLK
ncbi:ATP-dependent RNA helicase DbpA [Francisellaceae bacterium CB299]|jgi:ATP-independent RNA helicase DbpA